MLNLGLAAIAGLAAVLLTPVVWLVLRLAGLVPMLALAADMHLWRLHLAAGLFGLVAAWGVSDLWQRLPAVVDAVVLAGGLRCGPVVNDFFPSRAF